ncbi:MAG: glutathione S-transferase family protein [Gammaproteobacteria bacterium]|nr:glutathione S-transferase family protein [Gammaproteobacteria bacterium]MDP2139821.1 glutathione S-transferase family protein [Gammaproteobacteria bacterium]MDP2347061.1 glutathione S-transferase family protein [Gammaproteobacteria bacterium]
MLTIHGAPPSIHTRKVIVAALEKNLPYRVNVVFPFDPPPNWLMLSPSGKIPAISDDDYHLADSSAILAYLDRAYPQSPLYPTDARQYGQAIWFEEFVDGNVAPQIVRLFHEVILAPMHNLVPDLTVINDVRTTQLPPLFDYLESALQDEFLVGNSITVADITLASDLMMLYYLGSKLDVDRHPQLRAYFRRMVNRHSFRTALAAEAEFADKLGLDSGFLNNLLD